MGRPAQTNANWQCRFVGSLGCRMVFPGRPCDVNGGPILVETRVISASSDTLVVDTAAAAGEPFVANVQHIGRVAGTVSAAGRHASVLAIDANDSDKKAISARIAWLKKRHSYQARDARKEKRTPQAGKHAYLYVDDLEIGCSVIDISPSGIGVSLPLHPLFVGARLAVGCVPMRVVRVFKGGFGARFDEPLGSSDLDQVYLRL